MRKFAMVLLSMVFVVTEVTTAQVMCSQIRNEKVKPGEATLSISEIQAIRDTAEVLLLDMKPAERSKMVEEAIRFLNEVTALETSIRNYSEVTGGYERKTVLEEKKRVRKLRLQLSLEAPAPAVEIYRLIFRHVEQGYMTILNHTSEIKRLSRTKTSREKNKDKIEQLNAELQDAFVKFGENYGEYKDIRILLETMATKEATQGRVLDQRSIKEKKMAQFILASLGLKPDLASRVGDVRIDSWSRPDLASVTHVFRQHPEVLLAKLKRDKKEEKALAYRVAALSYPLFNFLKLLVFKLPARLRGPVTTMLNLSYDSHLLSRYLDPIDRVISVREQPELQLDLLRELNSRSDIQDEMLVTFARLTFMNTSWRTIREYADQRGVDNQIYKQFAERMAKAEEQAIKDKELATHFETTTFQKLLAALSAAGTAGTAYFMPELLQGGADAISTVSGFIGAAFGG